MSHSHVVTPHGFPAEVPVPPGFHQFPQDLGSIHGEDGLQGIQGILPGGCIFPDPNHPQYHPHQHPNHSHNHFPHHHPANSNLDPSLTKISDYYQDHSSVSGDHSHMLPMPLAHPDEFSIGDSWCKMLAILDTEKN